MRIKEYILKRTIDSAITLICGYLLSFLIFVANTPFLKSSSTLVQLYLNMKSLFYGRLNNMIIELIGDRLYGTLLLLSLALPSSILIGLLLGTFIASKYNTNLDKVLTALLILLSSLPSWWLGFSLTYVFSYRIRLFPIHGYYDYVRWFRGVSFEEIPVFIYDILSHITIPVLAFTLNFTGFYYIIARSYIIEILKRDFINLAKAKGTSTLRVLFIHALRNGMPSILFTIAITPSMICTALTFLEITCSKPGLGWITYRFMVMHRENFEVLQALFCIFMTFNIILIFLLELVAFILDPRISNDEGKAYFTPTIREVLKCLIMLPRTIKFFSRYSWKNKVSFKGKIGICMLLAFIIMATIGSFLESNISNPCQPPSLIHPLGTDEWGRDVFIRLLKGTSTSLAEYLGAVSIALILGCYLGTLSGYYHGTFLSYFIDRLSDLSISMPLVIFVSVFPLNLSIPFLHPIILRSVILTGLGTWSITAKLVKSRILVIKQQGYVEAAKALGADDAHIASLHIFPEALRTGLSGIVFTAATAIGLQSGLDFIGYQRFTFSTIEEIKSAPIISWGNMIAYSTMYGRSISHMWWAIIPPALCMSLLVISTVWICDMIADIFSPYYYKSK